MWISVSAFSLILYIVICIVTDRMAHQQSATATEDWQLCWVSIHKRYKLKALQSLDPPLLSPDFAVLVPIYYHAFNGQLGSTKGSTHQSSQMKQCLTNSVQLKNRPLNHPNLTRFTGDSEVLVASCSPVINWRTTPQLCPTEKSPHQRGRGEGGFFSR